MSMYRHRLRAALKSLDISAEEVRRTENSLAPDLSDDALEARFGSPETYAHLMFPDAQNKPRYGFLLLGAVTGPLIWLSLLLMADLAVQPGVMLRPYAALIGLSVMVIGLVVEFGRYISLGRGTDRP